MLGRGIYEFMLPYHMHSPSTASSARRQSIGLVGVVKPVFGGKESHVGAFCKDKSYLLQCSAGSNGCVTIRAEGTATLYKVLCNKTCMRSWWSLVAVIVI